MFKQQGEKTDHISKEEFIEEFIEEYIKEKEETSKSTVQADIGTHSCNICS